MQIIIAQLFGIGAMLALISIYQQRERKRLLVAKLSADVCWVIHYLLLGAFGGAIPNFLGIFRELIFMQREKKGWADKIIWPILFILCGWALGIFTFASSINILPIAASTCVTISLWLKKPNLTKIITVPVCISFLIYDIAVGSYIGIINESVSIISIFIYFMRAKESKMNKSVFSSDFITEKKAKIYERIEIKDFAAKIEADTRYNESQNAKSFAEDINKSLFSDFEKSGDLMCHVSTFIVKSDTVYVSYYASVSCGEEDPESQVARLAYCKKSTPENKKYIDVMGAGDIFEGKEVTTVYDTIIMCRPDEPDNIYILWTASIDKKYYRLYRIFNVKSETLGDIGVNRFKVGEVTNDFSFSGMQNALAENGIGYKEFFADIGIMQKQSWRMENGVNYCYTGAYSGNFTCIIKSSDLITWEYVAQPNEGAENSGFENESKWENAVYLLDGKVYYCVRQWEPIFDEDKKYKFGTLYAFLTYYDLVTKKWAKPVLVGDSQSRSDFIFYHGELYLFHASKSREHLGILKINREDISKSEVVLQANMNGSCFYPFVQYFDGDTLGISYTVSRKHIRLATFDLRKYLQ